MSGAIRYLSLARKARLLELGENDVSQCVRHGKAKLIALAADSSANARSRAEGLALMSKLPFIVLPYTKEEVSLACGKAGCSMAAFTDLGLAASFVSALDGENPSGGYSDCAKIMAERSELKRTQTRKRKE